MVKKELEFKRLNREEIIIGIKNKRVTLNVFAFMFFLTAFVSIIAFYDKRFIMSYGFAFYNLWCTYRIIITSGDINTERILLRMEEDK